jgi:hypothetical protein
MAIAAVAAGAVGVVAGCDDVQPAVNIAITARASRRTMHLDNLIIFKGCVSKKG